MAVHTILVTRVFRVERTVEVKVEAPTAEEAADMVDNGAVDLPDWGEWNEVEYSLESEEATPA